jgi:hypothetical protein
VVLGEAVGGEVATGRHDAVVRCALSFVRILDDHLLVAFAKTPALQRFRFDIKRDPVWAFAAISEPGRG